MLAHRAIWDGWRNLPRAPSAREEKLQEDARQDYIRLVHEVNALDEALEAVRFTAIPPAAPGPAARRPVQLAGPDPCPDCYHAWSLHLKHCVAADMLVPEEDCGCMSYLSTTPPWSTE
jgi:hypothetical protein